MRRHPHLAPTSCFISHFSDHISILASSSVPTPPKTSESERSTGNVSMPDSDAHPSSPDRNSPRQGSINFDGPPEGTRVEPFEPSASSSHDPYLEPVMGIPVYNTRHDNPFSSHTANAHAEGTICSRRVCLVINIVLTVLAAIYLIWEYLRKKVSNPFWCLCMPQKN